MRRPFAAPLTEERCTKPVRLRDGSYADCMHRRIAGTERCWQHPIVCKACTHRQASGLPGLCPACPNERTREDLARERAAHGDKS